MNVKCYTVKDSTVYSGIAGSVLGIDSDTPVNSVSINTKRPADSTEATDIGDTPWETEYSFTITDTPTHIRGGLVHISLNEWLPCPQLGDRSILMEVYNDGTGLLFMPRMGGALKSNSNGLFLVSGNSGKPEIGLSGPTGVMRRSFYRGVEQKPKVPNIPIQPEISALVASLKTYRDTLKPLPLPQVPVSSDPPNSQE